MPTPSNRQRDPTPKEIAAECAKIRAENEAKSLPSYQHVGKYVAAERVRQFRSSIGVPCE